MSREWRPATRRMSLAEYWLTPRARQTSPASVRCRISIMSPRRKSPSAPTTPPGSSEAPLPRSASAAPVSTRIAPGSSGACRSQYLRAATRVCAAWMRVPNNRPWLSARTTSALRPLNRQVSMPTRPALAAASSLVCMPPVPAPLPAPPAIASTSTVSSGTSWIGRACGSRRGSALYRPSMSVAMNSTSASISAATVAARLSLSPSLSSSTETVSFSLTTGSAPSRSSSLSVARALR